MIGLGSSIAKPGKIGKRIVRDNLVLKHDYNAGSNQPVSTGAAYFDGTNDYIDVGTIAISTGDVSVSAWVYVTTFTAYAPIFSNRESGGSRLGIELRTSSDGFELNYDHGGTSISSTSAAKNTNQWYHVCGVLDRSGNQYLYVDGVQTDPKSINATDVTHTTTARIGTSSNGATDFSGYVCNVGYWNAALTQAQVKSIMHKDYAALSASEKTDLVSWWNLDSVIDSDIGTGVVVYDNHYAGGSEFGSELITGGDFGGGGANWNTTDGWDDTGGFGAWDGESVPLHNNYIHQTFAGGYALVVGKVYKLTFTISNSAYGRQQVTFSGVGTEQEVTEENFPSGDGSTMGYGTYANGEHIIYFTAEVANNIINFYGHDGYSDFNVDDISLKLVNGNTGTLS